MSSDYQPVSPLSSAESDIAITTLYTSFNRLMLKVEAKTPGLLTLTIPYSPQWSASVQSQEYEVTHTDRNELAVFLPSGSHEVEFRFHSPASVAGMLISAGTVLLIAILLTRHLPAGWMRLAIVSVAIVVLAGGFALWNRSLYRGENLGMQFRWTASASR